jgi:hypothetical protein
VSRPAASTPQVRSPDRLLEPDRQHERPAAPVRGGRRRGGEALRQSSITCRSQSRLFVVGGRDGLKTLNTVECYDPIHRVWSPVPPMATHRHGGPRWPPRRHPRAGRVRAGGAALRRGGPRRMELPQHC